MKWPVRGDAQRRPGCDVSLSCPISRREMLVGSVLVAAIPRSAFAQSSASPVIGYLGPESPAPFASRLRAFHQGLAEGGYAEGRNLQIAYRWANGDYRRLPELASELIRRNVSLLVAPGGAPVALAAKQATTSIPIVFEMGGDPVQLRVVDSLSRPGGNITGVSSLSVEVSRKRLEFMRELRPRADRLAVAVNPTSPTAKSQLESLHAAAETLGVGLLVLEASQEDQFEGLFATASQLPDAALVFTSDPYFAFRSEQLAALASRHRVPAITQSRDFPMAGGLMSYGGDFVQSHRRAGVYAGRILKGENPGDLPVQLVTKVEFVVNLRAAKLLGLEMPTAQVSGSDEVIE
jgi:putative ABC transport system substrate-binding protein